MILPILFVASLPLTERVVASSREPDGNLWISTLRATSSSAVREEPRLLLGRSSKFVVEHLISSQDGSWVVAILSCVENESTELRLFSLKNRLTPVATLQFKARLPRPTWSGNKLKFHGSDRKNFALEITIHSDEPPKTAYVPEKGYLVPPNVPHAEEAESVLKKLDLTWPLALHGGNFIEASDFDSRFGTTIISTDGTKILCWARDPDVATFGSVMLLSKVGIQWQQLRICSGLWPRMVLGKDYFLVRPDKYTSQWHVYSLDSGKRLSSFIAEDADIVPSGG